VNDLGVHIARRRAAKAAYRRRKTFETRFADLLVTKKKRCVRMTIRQGDGLYAHIDLHDELLDRLVQRLQAIRGGRKAHRQ
jgi:hypothetical protein